MTVRSGLVIGLVAALALLGLFWWINGRGSREFALSEVQRQGESISTTTSVVATPAEAPASNAREPFVRPAKARKGKRPPGPRAPEVSGPRAKLIVDVVAVETGAPIPEVSLFVEGSSQPGMTDAGGRAVLLASTGRELSLIAYAWKAQAESSVVHVDPLSEGEERSVRMRLPTAFDREWFARVVDRETSSPILAADVSVFCIVHVQSDGPQLDTRLGEATLYAFMFDRTFEDHPCLARGTTDGDGRIALRLPSWGVQVARAHASGYSWRAVVPEGHGSDADSATIALLRSATLEVVVREAGSAAEGVEVRLNVAGIGREQDADLTVPDLRRSATTDVSGTCTLTDLPARIPIDVELARGDRVLLRPRDVTSSDPRLFLEPGERRRIEWRLETGCVLTGIAADGEDRALVGLELVLADGFDGEPGTWDDVEEGEAFTSVKTDAEGRFTITDVPAGEWGIGPEIRTKSLPLVAWLFRIAPEETSKELVLRFDPRPIRGRVVDPDGAIVAGASVWTRAVGNEDLFDVTETSPEGDFSLGPLQAGEYVVSAQSDDAFLAPSEEVAVRAGRADVVLQLRRGGVLRGRVKDEAGAAVAAHVELYRDGTLTDDNYSYAFALEPPTRDVFAFEQLVPGRYDVVARTDDGRVGVLRDLAIGPRSELEGLVTVRPGCDVRLRLRESEQAGRGFHVIWEGLTLERGWLEPGEEVGVPVPPGRMTVSWRTYDENVDRWSLDRDDERVIASPKDEVVVAYPPE